MTTFLLFGSLTLCLILTVPIAVSLGVASLLTALSSGIIRPSFVVTSLTTAIDSFPLMAVPLFILAGNLMGKGGISERLMKTANVFVGRRTGGLALVTILTCMFFAAISGSGPATVVAIGSIMVPEMLKKGYSKHFAAGLVATAGGIGVIIPPSVPMVLFGVSTETSIGALFIAGFFPGIFIGVSLMILAHYIAKRHGYTGDATIYTAAEKLSVVLEAKWALIMPFIILGGIYGGVFTPTEAAGISVIYAVIVGFFAYKTLSVKDTLIALRDSAATTATAILVAGTALAFARILALQQIPQLVVQGLLSVSDSMFVITLIINILLLIVGCFMDTGAAILILAPLLLPVAKSIGLHPVHLGIIMVVNLAIGFVTPPVGINLFMICGIAKMKLEDAAKAAVPWMLVMLVCLIVITYVPWLSLFLPRLLGLM